MAFASGTEPFPPCPKQYSLRYVISLKAECCFEIMLPSEL